MRQFLIPEHQKGKFILGCIALLLITGSIGLAKSIGLTPTFLHIIGAYLSIVFIFIVAYKASLLFGFFSLLFGVLSTGGGTILNLYRTIDSYDKWIHFFSGILLAEVGRLFVVYLFKKYQLKLQQTMIALFAFLFSVSAAAVWEIYEFVVDLILSTHMQGNNFNTMGDVISGTLGGLCYIGGYILPFCKRKNDKK